MLVCEGTVMGLVESPTKTDSRGEPFTTWTLQVFGGGDHPHYLDLPKNFERGLIPPAGSPIRAAVSVRPYASVNARGGAGASLTLRAVLPPHVSSVPSSVPSAPEGDPWASESLPTHRVHVPSA